VNYRYVRVVGKAASIAIQTWVRNNDKTKAYNTRCSKKNSVATGSSFKIPVWWRRAVALPSCGPAPCGPHTGVKRI